MRYWYAFLRFLGYRIYDAADATWKPVTGANMTHLAFYQRSLNAAMAQTIDWTSDTIKVRLLPGNYSPAMHRFDGRLWCDWRWVD